MTISATTRPFTKVSTAHSSTTLLLLPKTHYAQKQSSSVTTTINSPPIRTAAQVVAVVAGKDGQGYILVTKLKPQETWSNKDRRWHVTGYVFSGVSKYSERPITPAQERSGPEANGYFASEVPGKQGVVTDRYGKRMTSLPEAERRVLDMMRHGGLTTSTDAQARYAAQVQQRIYAAKKKGLGSQRFYANTQVTGAGANGRALPLFQGKSSDLPPIRQWSDYLPRMQYALDRAAQWAGPVLAAQLRALASPQGALMFMSLAALNLTPAGPAISATLVAVAGMRFTEAVLRLLGLVLNGKDVGDLNQAGRILARGLSSGVINLALGAVMRLTGKSVKGLQVAYQNARAYQGVRKAFSEPRDFNDVRKLLLFLEDAGTAYRQLPTEMKIAVREGLVAAKGLAHTKIQSNAISKALNLLDKIDSGVVGSRPPRPSISARPQKSLTTLALPQLRVPVKWLKDRLGHGISLDKVSAQFLLTAISMQVDTPRRAAELIVALGRSEQGRALLRDSRISQALQARLSASNTRVPLAVAQQTGDINSLSNQSITSQGALSNGQIAPGSQYSVNSSQKDAIHIVPIRFNSKFLLLTHQEEQTAKVLFGISKFNPGEATPEQVIHMLTDAAYDATALHIVARAIASARPDLLHTSTFTAVSGESKLAQGLLAETLNSEPNVVPPRLQQLFKRDAWRRHYQKTQNNPPSALAARGIALWIRQNKLTLKDMTFVDIGAGNGNTSIKVLQLGGQVIAIDPEPSSAEFLNSRVTAQEKERLTIFSKEFERVPLKTESVDIIFAERTLPHVKFDQLKNNFNKVLNVLKPGGLFVFDMFGPQHALAQRGEINVLDAQGIRSLLPLGLEILEIKSDGALTTVIAHKTKNGD